MSTHPASNAPHTTPTAPGAPAAASLGHFGLAVRDRERSTAFYRRLLGLEVLAESDVGGVRTAFLGSDGELCLTLWQTAERDFEPAGAGLHHLAFRAARAADLAAYSERLAELGVRLHHGGPVLHAEGADSGGLFFHGPDGERVEIFATDAAALGLPAVEGPACGFF